MIEKFKENKHLILLFESICLIIITILIISNSLIINGKEVSDYSYGPNSVVNYVGYNYDNNKFYLEDKDNHYITFEHKGYSDTFSVVFNNTPKEDILIHVWYMDGNGNINCEYDKTWEKNNHVVSFEDIGSNSSLISICLDDDVDLYMTIDSNIVHNNIFVVVLLIISFSIMIVLIVLYKLNHLNVLLRFIEIINNFVIEKVQNNKIYIILTPVVFLGAFCTSWIGGEIVEISCFNYKSIMVLFFLIYLVLIVVGFIRRKKSFAALSFFCILFLGTMFSFLEPASVGVSWDDEIHYDRTLKLSHVFDRKEYLVNETFINNYSAVALDHLTYSKEESDDFNSFYNDIYKGKFYIKYEDNKIVPSRIVYLPMAFGLAFARGINLPFNMCIMLGRWFNLICYAILAYVISKKSKYGSIVAVMVMMIPTNIFLASSYSYDTWVTEWSILGLSLLFNEMQSADKKICKSSMILIPLSFCLASFAKQIYLVMAIAAIFLEKAKFNNEKQKWGYRGLVVLSMLIPSLLMYFERLITFTGDGDLRGGTEVNSGEQLQYIFNNLEKYCRTLFNFLKEYLNPITCNAHGNAYIDLLGYNGFMDVYLVVLIVIIVASLIDHENIRGTFPIWYRLGIIILYIGVGSLCATALYISFTPVGVGYISGCQGRYILPMIFPVLYVLSRIPVKTYIINKLGKKNIYAFFVSVLALINFYCLLKGCVISYI